MVFAVLSFCDVLSSSGFVIAHGMFEWVIDDAREVNFLFVLSKLLSNRNHLRRKLNLLFWSTSHCRIFFSCFKLPKRTKRYLRLLSPDYFSNLTIKHNWNSSFVVDQSREGENSNFVGQLDVVCFDELNVVLVGVVVDCFEAFKDGWARFASVAICEISSNHLNYSTNYHKSQAYRRIQPSAQCHWSKLEGFVDQLIQSCLV